MTFLARGAIGALPWLLLAISRLSSAACECGYSLNKTSDARYEVFTDLLENDFLHTSSIAQTGWWAQNYTVGSDTSRGPYGKAFKVDNVVANPLKDKNKWSGEGKKGGDAGLQLWVRGDHSSGNIGGAEYVTERTDTIWGSYRVGMKLSATNGTCGAFFWFHNNSQEIDLEFLSKEYQDQEGVVNLVLQTPMSVQAGYDASNTSVYRIQKLPFRPDNNFHEYRFDWTKDKVSFYVDGQWLHDMTDYVPSTPGTMFLNHWSNGDPYWSAGPPNKDTAMTVSYVKAYFNSSTEARQKAFTKRCKTMDLAKVCEIPAQTVAPDAQLSGENGPKVHFFSSIEGHTPGQSTRLTGGSARQASAVLLSTVVPAVMTFLLLW